MEVLIKRPMIIHFILYLSFSFFFLHSRWESGHAPEMRAILSPILKTSYYWTIILYVIMKENCFWNLYEHELLGCVPYIRK